MIIKKIMPKSSIARKRVAAYCRVSTLREDQVESFETQRRYYADLIESHPEWEMVKIYADRHSATKAENRPGFQEMAADAQARKLDIILCKSISRFSRNVVDCQRYTKWFQKQRRRTARDFRRWLPMPKRESWTSSSAKASPAFPATWWTVNGTPNGFRPLELRSSLRNRTYERMTPLLILSFQ